MRDKVLVSTNFSLINRLESFTLRDDVIFEVIRKIRSFIRTVLQRLKLDVKWMLHIQLTRFQ